MKLNTRVAAVTLSIAAIISAGVVNTAGAASGPPAPITHANQGAPLNTAPPEQKAAELAEAIETGAVQSEKPKPAKVVEVPAAPKAQIVEKPAAVEAAPVVEAEPKSGCN